MNTPHGALPSMSAGLDPARESRLRRQMQRAEAYLAAGDPRAAAAAFDAALAIQPDNVGALLNRADLYLRAGQHNPGRELILKAVEGHLATPKLALQLVGALGAIGEAGIVMEIARQLPPHMWDSAKSLAELAHLLIQLGANEQAREFARAGVARDPRHPPSLSAHATLDVFFGDKDSAAEHCERCIALLPGDPGSHWLLSRLRLPNAGQRIDRIGRALDQSGLGADDEAMLANALHNELHEQGDYARAWAALERSCRAKRSTLDYSAERAAALFERLRAWSPDEVTRGDGFNHDGLRPVFVIGLHRSGTTLAERILSGHSQVTAGGETYEVRSQLRQASGLHFGTELDARVLEARAGFDYRAIGQGYLRAMQWRNRGTPLLTDKLPSNYYNVGFIARALPQARFIHLRRDPVDVGLSSLRTLFSHACPYSYDQLEYVAHYRQYLDLMAHWRRVLPDRILDVDYDALVQAPEATAARMAEFCGLEYEPQMLAIERRNDAVSTASSVMMRDGIRRDRGEIWRAYESQLAPMIQALQA